MDAQSFTTPIKDMLVPALRELAKALQIPSTGKKGELLTKIKAHLDIHPELANDPKYRQLYGGTKGSERGFKTTVPTISTDRASQDARAAASSTTQDKTPCAHFA